MINVIKSSFEIAYKTFKKDISLQECLQKYFDAHAMAPEQRKNIVKICINFFRNNLALYELLEDAFPKLRTNDFFILGVSLTDYLFVNSLCKEENICTVIELLRSNKSNLSEDMVERLFDSIHQYKDLIPQNIKNGTKKYLSLKYNLPLWVVNLWSKHYGTNVAEKLMQHVRKYAYKNFRINRLKTSYQKVMNSSPDFVGGRSITLTTVVYKSFKDWKNLSLYENGEIIPITEGMNHLINKLHLRANDEVLVIDYMKTNAALAMVESSNDKAHITLYCENEDDKYTFNHRVKSYGFTHIEAGDGPLSRLFTYISSTKDLVFLCPKSTNFNSINNNPDFFIHCKQEQLDSIIQGERDMLEEGAKYVSDNGLLVYAIETANNKEGSLLISEFLDLHNEFKLVEQRQTLQFDRRDTSFYFAILRKIGK
ncbi:MAG: hypothetical protein ACI311_01950 [Bacilli bacterium]